MNNIDIESLNIYTLALARINPYFVAKQIFSNPVIRNYLREDVKSFVLFQLSPRDREDLATFYLLQSNSLCS